MCLYLLVTFTRSTIAAINGSTQLSACESDIQKTASYTYTAIAIELLTLLGSIGVSLKFVRYTNEVTVTFLVQSYISTVLVFAGIYCSMYLLSATFGECLQTLCLRYLLCCIRIVRVVANH